MKKISDFLSGEGINEDFYSLFKGKAEDLTVTVRRASSAKEAVGFVFEEIKRLKIQNAAAPPLSLLDDKELENTLCSAGVDFCRDLDPEKIERVDMGISEFELGVAQLGSLFQDASGLHTRLVSMLPPVHLALLRTPALVETFAEALEVIEKVYDGEMPPYLSFITGPSKTADIERELTIGVHGPGTLIILFID